MAPTAEALMRSRYSAYVLGLHGYLLDTWHPSTRPAVIDADPPGLRWLGLQVRNCVELSTDHSTVEFIARSKLGGRATSSASTIDGSMWARSVPKGVPAEP
jgi:SEC-C motif domain protein